MNPLLLVIISLVITPAFSSEIVIPESLDDPSDVPTSQLVSDTARIEIVCSKRLYDSLIAYQKRNHPNDPIDEPSARTRTQCLEGSLALRNTDGKLLALSEKIFDFRPYYYFEGDMRDRLNSIDQDFREVLSVHISNHRDREILTNIIHAAARKNHPFSIPISSNLLRVYWDVLSKKLRWTKTPQYSDWINQQKPSCEKDNEPRRQIGRGIEWNNQSISIFCIESECKNLHVRLTRLDRQCSYNLTPPIQIKEWSEKGVLNAIKDTISQSFITEDIVQLMVGAENVYRKTFDGKPENTETRVWLPLYEKYLHDLFDKAAVSSLLRREVKLWQFRPRSVGRKEFLTWLAQFNNFPSDYFSYSPSCLYSKLIINPTLIRVHKTMPAWGLSGYEAFNLGTDNHELEGLILTPVMGRYMKNHFTPYIGIDPHAQNDRSIEVSLEWEERGLFERQGYKITFVERAGKEIKTRSTYHTSFEAKDYPEMVRDFTKKLGCK